MELYLLRHGIAEDHSETGRDEDRRLTAEGRRKLESVLERAHAAGASPTAIFSSPLRRALETAELAARGLGYEGRIVRHSRADARFVTARGLEIRARARQKKHLFLLVGHEPLFSAIRPPILSRIDARHGSIPQRCIDPHGSRRRRAAMLPEAVLQWMLTPKLG